MEDKAEIKVYEYHEHIRLRPGMYIGDVGDRGILDLIKGLTDDIAGRVSSAVSITYALLDSYNIELSINSLQPDVIYTSFIATDYFNQNMYPLAAKALCSSFDITYKGQQQKFQKGVKVSSQDYPYSDIVNVKLTIDQSIFPNIELDYYLLCQMLYYTALLSPTAKIKVEDRRGGSDDAVTFNFPEGIKSHFQRLCTVIYSQVKYEIITARTIGSREYEICIGWGDFRYGDAKHQTYCNHEYLKWGGSLIDGIRQGLITTYKRNSSDEVKVNSKLSAITIVAVLKTPEPHWYGSTKTALDMPEVKREAKKIMVEAVGEYFAANPQKKETLLVNMCRY